MRLGFTAIERQSPTGELHGIASRVFMEAGTIPGAWWLQTDSLMGDGFVDALGKVFRLHRTRFWAHFRISDLTCPHVTRTRECQALGVTWEPRKGHPGCVRGQLLRVERPIRGPQAARQASVSRQPNVQDDPFSGQEGARGRLEP